MKKSILITILVAVMLLAAIGSVNAATVTADKTTVKAGETVIVTVKPSEARNGVQFDVTYNASEFEYLGTETPTGMIKTDKVANGTGRVMVYSMDGTTTEAVVMKFKALKAVDGASIAVSGFVSGEERLDNAGSVSVKVEKAEAKDPVKDPDKKPGETQKPDDTKNPVDINGKPIKTHPQTGTPVYVAAVALIVVAAGAIFVIRKNK